MPSLRIISAAPRLTPDAALDLMEGFTGAELLRIARDGLDTATRHAENPAAERLVLNGLTAAWAALTVIVFDGTDPMPAAEAEPRAAHVVPHPALTTRTTAA